MSPGEPWKRLRLGMLGLPLSELQSYCFASNTVPGCDVICVSDLEVFAYVGSITVPPFVCVCGYEGVCAGVDVTCVCVCGGLG